MSFLVYISEFSPSYLNSLIMRGQENSPLRPFPMWLGCRRKRPASLLRWFTLYTLQVDTTKITSRSMCAIGVRPKIAVKKKTQNTLPKQPNIQHLGHIVVTTFRKWKCYIATKWIAVIFEFQKAPILVELHFQLLLSVKWIKIDVRCLHY